MRSIYEKFKDTLRKILVKYRYSVILDYKKDCISEKYRALLYYKNTPFVLSGANDRCHTNNWEIIEIVKILNRFGFVVDLIDRNINTGYIPEDKYDLFIGNAAGNSGKHYLTYSKVLNKAIKIFYAAGPDPETSNSLIDDRYSYMKSRIKIEGNIEQRRLIDRVNTSESMENTDFIFSIGNDFSIGTYKKYNKPNFRIYPSSYSEIKFYPDKICESNKRNFLYFGGSGNFVKGLDVTIESFLQTPDLNLYICAPHESEFDDIYLEKLKRSKNIHFVGFVDISSNEFRDLTNMCGFVILPSCSEGTATSVTTCMRAGLIPVVTYECGIDLDDFGFIIKDIDPDILSKQLLDISNISLDEFRQRTFSCYFESYKYTQQSFTRSLEYAITSVMKQKGL